MQALFFMDMRGDLSAEMLAFYCDHFPPPPKAMPFLIELVEGVLNTGTQIDAVIETFSSNWKMSRMSCVDRNILRLAVYELLFRQDIPSKVSLNEAIDVGKKFGTEESGAFINGVLDSIHLACEKGDPRMIEIVKEVPKV